MSSNPSNVTIMDVVNLLGLDINPRGPRGDSFNVKCPFCDTPNDRKYHMNVNVAKNVYFCPRCMMDGSYKNTGTLDLYGRVRFGEPLRPGVNGKKLHHQLMVELEGNSTYISKPRENDYKPFEEINPPKDSVLNKTFSEMIKLPMLELSSEHKSNLEKRGFSKNGIEKGGYCTFPPAKELLEKIDPHKRMRRIVREAGIDRICAQDAKLKGTPKNSIYAGMVIAHELLKRGVSIKNVPGFFQLTENYWCFRYESGMFVPTKNIHGEIVGGQIRLDTVRKGGLRYMTVSSKGFPCGPNANISRTHFTSSKEVTNATTVMITEGPLKGNAILDMSVQKDQDADVAVIAIQGVNNTRELPEIIQWLNGKGVTHYFNMLDMDKYVNPHVKKASDAINEIFRANGADIQEAIWDAKFALWEAKQMAALCQMLGQDVKLSRNPYSDLTGMAEFLGRRDTAAALKKMLPQFQKDGILGKLTMLSDDGTYHGFWRPETKGYDDFLAHNNQSKRAR